MDNLQLKPVLSIPECNQDKLTFAKSDNESIRLWIQNLPKANLGEMARQLYFALQEINQVRLPVSKRISILELLRPSIHYTCRTLSRHYLKKSVTLTQKERKVANLAQALQSHLLIGYKIIVMQQLDTDIDLQGKKNLVIALHRAINESCYTLLRCYQLYCDTPKSIWRELHILYRLAEDYRVNISTVEDNENKHAQITSIDESYKKALLLSRARPNMLRQLELDQLFQVLEKWSGSASLEKSVSHKTPFAINIQSDMAPLYSVDIAIDNPENFRGLDTQQLTNNIIDNSPNNDITSTFSNTLINHLLSSWGPKTARSHSRKGATGRISFAAGLSATHFFLANETPFHETFKEPEADKEQVRSNFESPSDSDVWDHVSGIQSSATRVPGSLGEMLAFNEDEHIKEPTSYPIFQASLIDTSPGGYCVTIDGDVPAQIQAGELISIHSPSGRQWMLSIIRWVRLESANRVIFGIQLLSPNARPTAISILHKKREASDFLRCFYLPEFRELDEPAYLITPRVPFHIGSKVRFFDGEHFIQATLTECTISTGSFSQYQFNIVSATAPQQIAATEQKQEVGDNDNFNSLWADL